MSNDGNADSDAQEEHSHVALSLDTDRLVGILALSTMQQIGTT